MGRKSNGKINKPSPATLREEDGLSVGHDEATKLAFIRIRVGKQVLTVTLKPQSAAEVANVLMNVAVKLQSGEL